MCNNEFYLTTGKKDFESLFYPKGGIRVDCNEGTTLLIEGSAGVGKTTLAVEIVKNAVLLNNAKCLYYIFDQTAKEIKLMLENFKWHKGISINAYQWHEVDEANSIGKKFNIVETKSLEKIDEQMRKIKNHAGKLRNCENKIIVIDSIGANSKLAQLDRETFSSFLNELKGSKTIVILIREKDKDLLTIQNEYLTNAVVDLQVRNTELINGLPGGAFITSIEIKKTRNQASLRGPHEFIIRSPQTKNILQEDDSTGFIIYPSLQSVAKINELSREEDKNIAKFRAEFDLEPLDSLIGEEEILKGIPFGQTILLKGPPGNHKTDLSLQFLLNKDKAERTLFVSCRLDKAALKTNDLFKISSNLKEDFFNKMVFIDARESYKTPEMIMSQIKEKVEGTYNTEEELDFIKNNPIKRAVIFGVSMLETLPMFKGSALHFLQVLLSYFKTAKISSIWVDWMLSQDQSKDREKPLLQTEFASHLVAAELTVEQIPTPEDEDFKLYKSKDGYETLLKVTRKNYRSYKETVGILKIFRNKLELFEIGNEGKIKVVK